MKRYGMALLAAGVVGAVVLTGMGARDLYLAPREAARQAAAMRAVDAVPEAMPTDPVEAQDAYRAVRVHGMLLPDPVTRPVDHPEMGPGLRVFQVLETPEGRITLDRGFLYDAWAQDPLTATEVEVNGTLVWRDAEVARDLGAALPILVATTPTGDGIVPMPARAPAPPLRRPWMWFGLALAWVGMTWRATSRIKRRGEGNVTQ
ncbi:SURF1 family cytochrome oxidase biogenesis protein [Falsirhodobacter halotolerans]|uniref:SURF1 family cytochrome oxidase biogenesis protein n=1 Tax=Falsirhodobacter halotolerans TaxID=1146892 RepID=UPI001FD53196|nr:SURF1 family cytochrome oxidase biogenesis protein [Falsirhodobacter halotolerans]MCJ8139277.1 hypothetical protein [Falsirhodobacter halotolerans]